MKDLVADRTVKISAKTGDGIENMLDVISEVIADGKKLLDKVFGYDEASVVASVRKVWSDSGGGIPKRRNLYKGSNSEKSIWYPLRERGEEKRRLGRNESYSMCRFKLGDKQ